MASSKLAEMEWREDPLDYQRRQLRQAMGVSLVVHLSLGSLLLLAPPPEPLVLPPAISVDLVAALPSAPPAPEAAAKPPTPVPAPPPPRPAVKVLPKRAPKATAKPRPKEREQEREVVRRRERRDISYDDAMKELREELGDASPIIAPPQQRAKAPAAPQAPARTERAGTRTATEHDVWALSVKRHIRKQYYVPEDFKRQPLAALVEIRVDERGEVIGAPRLLRSSGNPYYDDNTVRAIRKASPLPRPPKAGRYQVIFPSDE